MKFVKCLKIAFSMLKGSKLRSWLTVIGIVIAVSSITTILSFSEAIKTEVENKVGSSGANVLTVYPGWSEDGATYVTVKDLEFLKKNSQVDKIRRQRDVYSKVVFFGEEKSERLKGVEVESFRDFNTLEILKGRGFKKGDSNVFLIDEKGMNETFKKKLKIGSFVEIDGENFKLIGVYKVSGFFGGDGFMIPFGNAQDVFNRQKEEEDRNRREKMMDASGNSSSELLSFEDDLPSGVSEDEVYSSLEVKLKNGVDIKEATKSIESDLIYFRRTNKKEPNFYIVGKDAIMDSINQVVSIVTWVLVGFAGISVLVGSVGIANTMYTSVLEKTKEIGIMKAIGAKNKDVKVIFLLNSGIIGLFGGVIGVIIGLCFSFFGTFLVAHFAEFTDFSYFNLLSFKVIFGALIFSILIGMMSGFLPSKQAARLKPVDALRY
jgi:putative ABC transport system permease protein